MEKHKWDVFISHSHEDKHFVEVLADKLVSMGLNVWYDSFVLELGDSLSKKINEGLANSTYGIVVLSHSFFKKEWTQLEIAALLNKEINNKKVIIPIWHNISFEELRNVAPLLVDKLAANSNDSAEKIAYQVLKIVHPGHFTSQTYTEPIEIDSLEGTKLIILPCHPFKDWVVGISKYPITNKQYKNYLSNLKKEEKKDIEWMTRETVGFSRNNCKISFEEPMGQIYDGQQWSGPFYPWLDTRFNHPDMPVVCVSLLESIGFSQWMSKQEKNFTSMLPTPELWDYAAFGKMHPERKSSSWLQTVKTIHQEANAPTEVFNKGERINSRGVSDMFGNVWEWCEPNNSNSRGIAILGRSRDSKISAELRGGGYLDNLNQISPFISTSLLEDGIGTRHTDLGFRIAVLINTTDIKRETLAKLWACKDSSEPFIREYLNDYW